MYSSYKWKSLFTRICRIFKSLNVDNLFIYDNNDINWEYPEENLTNWIKSGFVKIINYRGKKRAFLDMMNHCYKVN